MDRQTEIERKTKETAIRLKLNLDGRGESSVNTGIPFMDHMLTLFAAHGFIDVHLDARGDTEVDHHHTVEDIGICLGLAIKEASGDKKGIKRYGEATVPMDEALARVVVDMSNRPFLAYRVLLDKGTTGTFDTALLKEFLRALVNNAGMTLHVDLLAGDNAHHASEAIFKALARAVDAATAVENRLAGEVRSTKGVL